MKIPNMSLGHAGTSVINATFINTIGYAGATMFGMSAAAAAAVGSAGTMIGIAAVGSAALYIPTMLLRYSLDYPELMNDVVNEAINLAYFAGSAALGAIIVGVAIEPVITCACIGLIMYACFVALSSNNDASAAPNGTSLDDGQSQRARSSEPLLFSPLYRTRGGALVEEVEDNPEEGSNVHNSVQ